MRSRCPGPPQCLGGGTFRTSVHSVTAEIGGSKGGQPDQGSNTNCVSPGLGSLGLSCPFFKAGTVAGFLGLLGLGALLGPRALTWWHVCLLSTCCVQPSLTVTPFVRGSLTLLVHNGEMGRRRPRGVTCGPKKRAVSSQLLPRMGTEGSWQSGRARGEPGALRSFSPCACPYMFIKRGMI